MGPRPIGAFVFALPVLVAASCGEGFSAGMPVATDASDALVMGGASGTRGGSAGTTGAAGADGNGGRGGTSGAPADGGGNSDAAGADGGPDGALDACQAAPEICNGRDDDCDNQIDDNVTCPVSGQVCRAGSCQCPDGTFSCGDKCQNNAGCSSGEGSCRKDGIAICKPGGQVGCSVDPAPPICMPNTSQQCDPCGSGSAIVGTSLCDGYGCARAACIAGSGRAFTQYAPVWSHFCGTDHDGSGQNWRCENPAATSMACVCAQRSARLPAGSYRWRVTAGFPATNTPMTLRVLAGANQIASNSFDVSGLMFTTFELPFSLTGCTDVTFTIERSPASAAYVINLVTLDRI